MFSMYHYPFVLDAIKLSIVLTRILYDYNYSLRPFAFGGRW